MDRYKLFTHTDLDGLGCSILAQLVWEDEVDVEYCDYNNVDEEVNQFINEEKYLNYKQVFITDISVSLDTAQSIANISKHNFWLLDHHPTALILNKYPWCKVQIENSGKLKTCGTELFYHHLTSRQHLKEVSYIRQFVTLVRDWDTWRWSTLGENGLGSKAYNDLLHLRGKDYFINWAITEMALGYCPTPFGENLTLLKIRQKEIDDYIAKKNNEIHFTVIANRKCGIVFADRFVSELGNKLCSSHPNLDFVAIVDIGAKVVSYRTIKNYIDLGKDIASLYGGGGHPKAAGSQFDVVILDEIKKLLFDKEK